VKPTTDSAARRLSGAAVIVSRTTASGTRTNAGMLVSPVPATTTDWLSRPARDPHSDQRQTALARIEHEEAGIIGRGLTQTPAPPNRSR
jgi:hypothetical protein